MHGTLCCWLWLLDNFKGILAAKKLHGLTQKLILFHAIITPNYDNHIKFEVSFLADLAYCVACNVMQYCITAFNVLHTSFYTLGKMYRVVRQWRIVRKPPTGHGCFRLVSGGFRLVSAGFQRFFRQVYGGFRRITDNLSLTEDTVHVCKRRQKWYISCFKNWIRDRKNSRL